MPKRTKKLLIYLDQNFLSEISKADVNDKVKPEFKELYAVIQQGFQEEKLIVPQSEFHEIETSLAPSLKKRIVRFQNFIGQVSLNHPRIVQEHQIGAALLRFLWTDIDPLGIKIAFQDDPDKRVEPYNITVDSHLENLNLKGPRVNHAQNIEALRLRIKTEGLSYEQQLAQEHTDHRQEFFKIAAENYAHLCDNPAQELVWFGQSPEFIQIPYVSIHARLYARVLTASTRRIKESDATDIDVLSTFLPYMDVVGTDHFMVTQVQSLGIDKEYDVKVFSAKTASLQAFITYIKEYLQEVERVHRPAVSVFVLPTPDIKELSFEFYRTIGLAAKKLRDPEYAEIFGFDDGHMQQYELPRMPGKPLPFYGLMDVTPLPFPAGMTLEETLAVCRQHCQSDQFVLIDKHQELPEHFFDFVLLSVSAKKATTQGYTIYTTKP